MGLTEKIKMFLSPTGICQNQDISAKSRVSLFKEPILQFSMDEQLIIEGIHNKFEVSWLQNFIMLDRYLLDQTPNAFQLISKFLV